MANGSWLRVAVVGLLWCATVAPARAEDAPKPPGDTATESPARRKPGAMLGQLQENLAKLDLTEDQKSKIKSLLDDTRQKLTELREQAAKDEKINPREKLRTVMGDARAKLQEILTPDQQEKLRDLMQAGSPDPKPEAPSSPERIKPTEKKPHDTKTDEKTPGEIKADTKKPLDVPPMMKEPGDHQEKKTARPADEPASAMIEVGQPAPDISLKTVTDRPFTLASNKGKVVVIVFGSYSTPSFRQRISALEKLAKEYGSRATFVIVYTREAHAVGEWEVDRNKQEEIAVEQPKTEADRKAQANQAVNALKITLPVVVDTMDNATAKAYGLTPNGAVVINRDGTVAARQRWFEPIGLRPQIDTAVAARNAKE